MTARAFWIVGYVATIFVANWSISHVGDCSQLGPCTVPVWPGVAAPSGVVFVGLAFTLRDLVQETFGRYWTIAAILAGALLSAALSPQLALASGTAFLFSELADFGVYTPMRERTWLGAVAASNSVGLVVDSLLFLTLAFGSLDFLTGQIIGKLEMTVLAVVILAVGRGYLLSRHPSAELA